MINTHTGLPTVEELAHQNSKNSALDFGGLINNNGTFSSELQQARHQISGSLDSNKPPGESGSSETNHIKRKFSNSFSYLDLTFNNSIKTYFKIFVQSSKYFLNNLLNTFEV